MCSRSKRTPGLSQIVTLSLPLPLPSHPISERNHNLSAPLPSTDTASLTSILNNHFMCKTTNPISQFVRPQDDEWKNIQPDSLENLINQVQQFNDRSIDNSTPSVSPLDILTPPIRKSHFRSRKTIEWTVEDVCDFLFEIDLDQYCKVSFYFSFLLFFLPLLR
jgi:hypothetical protein